jgi:hypothetical protein
MGDATRMISVRHIGNCYRADQAYGEGVARALGIPISEVAEVEKHSLEKVSPLCLYAAPVWVYRSDSRHLAC